jgi:hypothetical protein
MLLAIVLLVAITAGYAAFFYFIFPLVFSPGALPWAFLAAYAAVNGSALLLSWVYFDRTRCYEDEMNPVAKVGYYIFGHDVAHVLLAAFRLGVGVVFFFSLFGLDAILFGTRFILPAQERIYLVMPIAIFASELTFNIHAIWKHWDDSCRAVPPMLCPCRGREGCYCDPDQI